MAAPVSPRCSPTANLFAKKFQDQLNCSVCLERFIEPKVLSCQHVFCQECVKTLGKEKGHICCPLCRRQTKLPKGSASQLPTAIQINALMEFQEELEKFKNTNSSTTTTAATTATTTTTTTASMQHSVCEKHEGIPLDVYCCTCKLLICCKCVISSNHKSHSCDMVSDMYPTIFQGILDQVNTVNTKMKDLQSRIEALDSRKTKILQQGQVTKDAIRLHAHQLIDKIQLSQNMLTYQIDDAIFKKTWVLDGQIEAAEIVYTELKSCVDSVQKKLIELTASDVIASSDQICREMGKTNNGTPPLSVFTPLETAELAFVPSLQDGTIGRVEGVSSTWKCFSDSMLNLPLCIPQQVSSATINLKSDNNCIPPSLIHCSLLYCKPVADEITQMVAHFKQQQTNGSYLFTFTVPDTRNVQLMVTVGGIELSRSPFKVPIISKAMATQKASRIIDGMERPWGISVSKDGRIVIAESEVGRISVIRGRTGLKTASFGKRGKNEGELEEPRGVAISHDQHILVADRLRVQKFTFNGVCVKSICMCDGQHAFKDLDGIAVTSTGTVMVSDHGNNIIHVFTANLSYSRSIDLSQDDLGGFKGPCGIAVDSNDNLFIAEKGNHCITKLTSAGKYISRFGQQHLFWPTALVVWNDMVYVCEERFHRVVIFDANRGKILHTFGSRGIYEGNFISPFGIGIDETENLLYICDSLNDRICCY